MNLISVALAALLVLVAVAVNRRWNPSSLKELAPTPEERILPTTGRRGEVPEIQGFEKVKTIRMDRYRAALYRASPAPLIFAPGRFVIYDANNYPVLRMETLEGSRESWTAVYDFAGKKGFSPANSRRPVFTKNLNGAEDPVALIGQYSGGDHCCTTVTVIELGKDQVRVVGRIDRLDGLPFEGLEIRNLDQTPAWEFIAHRPYRTACGSHDDSPDTLAVYAYADGAYTDQTPRFAAFLETVFRGNLLSWSREKNRTVRLLQTLATDYAALGQRDQGKRFFAMNLRAILPELQRKGVDPNACLEDIATLLDRLTGAVP